MQRNLDEILPLSAIEHDCIVSCNGDITIVYEAMLPEIFTLTEQDYETVHQSFIKAVRVLTPQTIFHKQDWFTESKIAADFNIERSFLASCSELFFNERPYLDHHCYIFLTKKASGRTPANSLMSNLLRKSIVPKQTLNDHLLEEFLAVAGQFTSILQDNGYIHLRRLNNEELSGTRNNSGLVQQYVMLDKVQHPSILHDLKFDTSLSIGGNHCLIFSLADAADLPAYCGSRINYDRYCTDKSKFSIGFTSNLCQLLSCNHIYNQYLVIEDTGKALKLLEGKRRRLQSLSAYSRENAITRDGTNDFLNEAIAEHRYPVKAHFNILAWTAEKENLPALKNQVATAIAQLDAVPKQEMTGAAQLFWAGIPGNAADLPINETFQTFAEQACCFLNLETNYRSSASPFGIRLGDRLTGKPLHVDISDEPMKRGICTNRNKFILGPSGSGKSFFTNHMVRSYYEQGTHVVLVDVGGSYKGLCNLLKGYYFTYEETNPICFNPFYIPKGELLDTEKKESIKTLLLALWKKDDESFRRSEYVALSNALHQYYDHLNHHAELFACFDSFYEFLQTDFINSLRSENVKDKDFDVSNFLYVLRPYYRGGEFHYLLNASRNLDLLQQPFIVFELDNIKDHPILLPVVTIIIMEVFISKMRKLKGIRKMILIEEAWKAIAREGMAEYIRYLFKTVRKFYGEAVVVTQEIEDIISSSIVKQTIINNADCKILLDQSKYQNRFSDIQQLLGLTEKESALILSINKANDPSKKYKEVFISLGSTVSKVYRTEVSIEEYLTYSTEEKEKIRLQEEIRSKGGDMQVALKSLAAEMRSN